jgi:hypothetical protein
MNANIAFLSRTLAKLATIGAILLPLGTIAGFLLAGSTNVLTNGNNDLGRLLTDAPLVWRLAALPFALVSDGFTIWALWSLRRLMLHYSRGEVFAFAPLQALNNLAAALFASVIVSFVMTFPQSLLLSWHLGAGHRQLSLQFSTSDIADLFMAGVVLVIARVMAEARRIADENATFV